MPGYFMVGFSWLLEMSSDDFFGISYEDRVQLFRSHNSSIGLFALALMNFNSLGYSRKVLSHVFSRSCMHIT